MADILAILLRGALVVAIVLVAVVGAAVARIVAPVERDCSGCCR